MSDREAFVSAIAANPADDLPRLVFADWLDEHGEGDRADFIRTQIRCHHALPDERIQLDARAADLLREHWMTWFGPFLRAIDPHADLARRYRYGGNFHPAMLAEISPVFATRDETPATHVYVSNGFVSLLGVDVGRWADGASLAEAFRHEPPRVLQCRDGLRSPRWERFTEPVLRRVEHLTLYQQWAWQVSAPESTALLEDPHLAGVRQFSLMSEDGRERWARTPLPVAWLERFVRSSLAYRLTGLHLPCISPEGVAPLCRPGRLQLERLELGGILTADGLRRLGGSESGTTVRELSLNTARLVNADVAALARDPWRKLTHLELRVNMLTAAVLPALASAAFVPQLKVLDLSGNPLFTPDTDGDELRPLADALDPERLEHLDLRETGLSVVPDFLAERFGDRVVV